jgi:hypothetical protein
VGVRARDPARKARRRRAEGALMEERRQERTQAVQPILLTMPDASRHSSRWSTQLLPSPTVRAPGTSNNGRPSAVWLTCLYTSPLQEIIQQLQLQKTTRSGMTVQQLQHSSLGAPRAYEHPSPDPPAALCNNNIFKDLGISSNPRPRLIVQREPRNSLQGVGVTA